MYEMCLFYDETNVCVINRCDVFQPPRLTGEFRTVQNSPVNLGERHENEADHEIEVAQH